MLVSSLYLMLAFIIFNPLSDFFDMLEVVGLVTLGALFLSASVKLIIYIMQRRWLEYDGILCISAITLCLSVFFCEISTNDVSAGIAIIIMYITMFLSPFFFLASCARYTLKKKQKQNSETKLTTQKRDRSLLKQTITGAAGYLSAVTVSFLYMLFLDEESGVIIFAAMLLVPLISLILTMIARSGIQLKITSSAEQISKGEEIILTISVTKKTVIPAPFIDLVLLVPASFNENTVIDTYRIAMSINKNTEIRIPMCGIISGRYYVGLHRATISDYLSIFRFNINEASMTICPVDIIPNVSSENDCSDVFSELTAHVSYSDEDEATSSVYTVNASPGYEHREYVPGDPLKRVNWKLSSKRGAMMIRLDEAPAIVRPVIILDYLLKARPDIKEVLLEYERCCEAMLSLVDLCARQSVECKVFFSDGMQIHKAETDNHDSVKRLALQLAEVNPEKLTLTKRCTGYDEIINACKVSQNVILFTNDTPTAVRALISTLEAGGGNAVAVFCSAGDADGGYFIDMQTNIRR